MPHRTTSPVTIGLPVWNGEETLGNAINTLLRQSFGDFNLVISDNASTDSTEEICKYYAASDPRIEYIRQPVNIGALRNFGFLLERARGKYFLWASHDDTRSDDYLDHNFAFLEANPDFVASTSPTRFEDGDFSQIELGDGSLEGDAESRFLDFFSFRPGNWHANGRFYSLFRTDALKIRYVQKEYLGADWSTVLGLTRDGKFKRLEQGFVVLGKGGASNRKDIFANLRDRRILWLFPFLDLTDFCYRESKTFSFQSRFQIFRRLAKLNYQAARSQIQFESGRRTSRLPPKSVD